MDVDKLLYHYITDGISHNTKKHVGLELEFPIVALDGGSVRIPALRGMLAALEPLGYHIAAVSDGGIPICARDEQGNAVTFDTCYENMEYVSASAPSLPPIYRRFRETLLAVQSALHHHGHQVLGIGYNPMMENHAPHLLQSELTLAIDRFFRSRAGVIARYRDFYCSISSEQVHFNTNVQELPLLFEAFTRLDWLNILLFSDSPATLAQGKFLCARNELYMRSGFHALGLVGAQELDVRTIEDIVRSYRRLGLFVRRRGGHSEVVAPVPVEEYFTQPRYHAQEEDIHCLDIERNLVTTAYGTVEYRVLCAQPFSDAFVPSAFNLGLREMLPEVLALARAFDERHALPAPNLRNEAASRGVPTFAPHEAMEAYALSLLALSRQGLERRGFGEEAFLAPLDARNAIFDSPAVCHLRDIHALGARAALLKRADTGTALL
ncbi:MAG: hypothetical protein RSG96_00610 [Clostridia bacterium]